MSGNSDWQVVKVTPMNYTKFKEQYFRNCSDQYASPKKTATLQIEENGDPRRENSRSACDLETPGIDLTGGEKPCSGGTVEGDRRSLEPWWSILSQLAECHEP